MKKSWMEKFGDMEHYQLNGNMHGSYTQPIDRDQAIDNGKATYDSYTLINLETGEQEHVTAEQMEEFAKTW